jgi:hypothetical protein
MVESEIQNSGHVSGGSRRDLALEVDDCGACAKGSGHSKNKTRLHPDTQETRYGEKKKGIISVGFLATKYQIRNKEHIEHICQVFIHL